MNGILGKYFSRFWLYNKGFPTGTAKCPAVMGLFLDPVKRSYGPRLLTTLSASSSVKLFELYWPGHRWEPLMKQLLRFTELQNKHR